MRNMANLIYRTTGKLFQNNVQNYRFSTQYISVLLNNRRFCSKENAVPKYFTKKHEWITVEGNVGTVGITDYAQSTLGDIVFVQLPKVGAKLNTTDECGALESVKAASELYSPVSGTVKEINESLEQKPELINMFCYDEGWLFKLTLKDKEELNELMKEKEYKEFIVSDQFNVIP